MPYEIVWMDEPWLLRVTYREMLTVEDLEDVMNVCIQAAEKHPINFLVDVTDAAGMEPAAMRSKSALALMKHPNTRWFGIVGIKGIIGWAMQVVMRFTSYKTFDTLSEAESFVLEMVKHQKEVARTAATSPRN